MLTCYSHMAGLTAKREEFIRSYILIDVYHTTKPFTTTYRRLRETGNIHNQEPRVSAVQHSVALDEMILQAFDEEPTTSKLIFAATLNLSIWKVWAVVRADERHALHYTPVQGK